MWGYSRSVIYSILNLISPTWVVLRISSEMFQDAANWNESKTNHSHILTVIYKLCEREVKWIYSAWFGWKAIPNWEGFYFRAVYKWIGEILYFIIFYCEMFYYVHKTNGCIHLYMKYEGFVYLFLKCLLLIVNKCMCNNVCSTLVCCWNTEDSF